MTTLLPPGYLKVLEAAELLLPFMFAGEPDRREIKKARANGMDGRDGIALYEIIDEVWESVNAGKLAVFAVGGQPCRILRIPSDLTKEVRLLQSPRGRGFAYLRPSSPAYRKITGWFGIDLSNVVPAFEAKEIRKLGQVLKRRRKTVTEKGKKSPGKPSLISRVQDVIFEIVKGGKRDASGSMKLLTYQVNDRGIFSKPVSEDTVTRALDLLYTATKDRRFQRINRKPRRS